MTAVGALWLDGAVVFTTGARSRKGRNLARDPSCAVSLSLHDFDLVIEGTASQVTDPVVVAEVAARYAADGWPAAPDATGQALTAEYSAPSAGPPPWHVYRISAESATALSTAERPAGRSERIGRGWIRPAERVRTTYATWGALFTAHQRGAR